MIPPLRSLRAGSLVSLALTAALALGGAPVHAAALLESPNPRSATAREHYSAGRYAEAARVFEAIWSDTGDPSVLYNAGMAREAAGAGHESHALHDWRRYLAAADTVAADERDDLERRIGLAAKHTAPFELLYDQVAGAPSPLRVELQREGAPPDDALQVTWSEGHQAAPVDLTTGSWTARLLLDDGSALEQTIKVQTPGSPVRVALASPEVPAATVVARFGPTRALSRGIEATWVGPSAPPAATLKESKKQWTLAPGAWALKATARGYLPLREELNLSSGQTQTIDLQLRRDPEEQARLGLALGLGGVGLGLIAGGAAQLGTAGYAGSETEFLDAVDAVNRGEGITDQDPHLSKLLWATTRETRGTGLIAGGVGAGIVATTVASRAKDRTLWAEFGLGGVSLAAGLASHIRFDRATPALQVNHKLDGDALKASLDDRRRTLHITSAVLGVGAGLTSAAITALFTRAIARRRAHRSERTAGGTYKNQDRSNNSEQRP